LTITRLHSTTNLLVLNCINRRGACLFYTTSLVLCYIATLPHTILRPKPSALHGIHRRSAGYYKTSTCSTSLLHYSALYIYIYICVYIYIYIERERERDRRGAHHAVDRSVDCTYKYSKFCINNTNLYTYICIHIYIYREREILFH